MTKFGQKNFLCFVMSAIALNNDFKNDFLLLKSKFYVIILRSNKKEHNMSNANCTINFFPLTSVTATVSIDVADVNDLTPTFNPIIYSVDVLESASFGPAVVIETLTVTDGDDGVNAATTLTITSGNGEGKFAMSGESGTISREGRT